MSDLPAFTFHPLTPDRWHDFETLLGPKGAYGGCWCMEWRNTPAEQKARKGEGNRRAMKGIVQSGPPPGLLAYDGDKPVGWCSVAPRAVFTRLERSRVLQPVDDSDVWSISCFFIARSHRKHGVSVGLLAAAADFVAEQGGTILEGYPIDPKKEPYPSPYAWTGLARAFRKAGFTEVLRRSETRPIMRKTVGGAA